MANTPRIAIIGAGPAGLTLARILQQNKVPVVVFEGETSRHARSQGGTLDLHPEHGQRALRDAGLMEEFERIARYDGEDFVLADRHAVQAVSIKDQNTERPEIDRVVLRNLLLDSVAPEDIRWDAGVTRVNENRMVHLKDGSTQGPFDLIVGADGAWSKVRPILTDVVPFYSGISGLELSYEDADNKHPDVSQLVGRGSYFAFGDGAGELSDHCILCQRMGDGKVNIYAMGKRPEGWCRSNEAVDNAKRAEVLKAYDAWAPVLRSLVELAEPVALRALYMLPVGLQWESKPGFTLVGDAAHLMTPFAGQGVNIAMADAADLAGAIVSSQDDLTKAVTDYEKRMFVRAKIATTMTAMSLKDRFEEGGVRKMKERIDQMMNKLKQEREKAGSK